jgi:hypothetical protein
MDNIYEGIDELLLVLFFSSFTHLFLYIPGSTRLYWATRARHSHHAQPTR